MHAQFLNGNVRYDDNVAGDNPYQHFDIIFAKVQAVDEMETKDGKSGIKVLINVIISQIMDTLPYNSHFMITFIHQDNLKL